MAAIGQDTFFSVDSVRNIGIKLRKGSAVSNSEYCKVISGNKIIKYSPSEVNEYGFGDGRTFKAFPIKLNNLTTRFFLERLDQGKVSLYYLRARGGITKYFIAESDTSDLTELPENQKEYSALIESFFRDCPQSVSNIQYIKLRKNLLKRYVQDYNHCLSRPFPRRMYGITAGITGTRLSAIKRESMYSGPVYCIDWGIQFGVFIDVPILPGNFSLHPQIYYNKYRVSKAFDYSTFSNDLVINYSTISIPLLIRYNILANKISPYVQAGPVYSRAIRNNGTFYEYELINKTIFTSIINSPVLQNDLGGFSVGGGIIINYASKFPLFCELNYKKLYNLKQENKFLNLNEITFGFGVLF